ncbi:oligoendopeptidase F [Anaerolineaceae bacterium oral taxon 439]|nr:oligoendopeptidase F [Anaerolineaceae bacterium oral taxon 439]
MSVYETGKWDLGDLFSGIEADDFKNALKEVDDRVKEIEGWRGKLDDSTTNAAFRELLGKIEAMETLVMRIYSFVNLMFTADSQDQKIIAMVGRIDALLAEIQNKTVFMSLWWKNLSDGVAADHLAALPEYRYYLTKMRQTKPYTLSESEEKIIATKNVSGAGAMQNLYSMITNRYTFELEVDGEKKTMTRGEISQYFRDPDPDVRRRAYEELYRVYAKDSAILTQIYQALVRDWDSEGLTIRGYETAMSVRNVENDIPGEVVDLLLAKAQENKGVFQRYFRLKAKLLGLEGMRRSDLYAPSEETKKRYSFDEAVRMVQAAFDGFDPEFKQKAMRVFNDRHIDSEIRAGKRDGAFCWTVCPDLTPYVQVNYQGKLEDVSTLAHELGHAIHSMMAEKQNIFQQHACLPLAETASTFCEMVLSDYLMAHETDKLVRRTLLMTSMDGNYATIQRQAYFALFERDAHALIREGADTDALNELYMKNLQDQFGDSLDVNAEFKGEWTVIPHIFYTPFYVYAYSFGQLLVLSLFKAYKEEGKSFIPRMKQLLATGGSLAPEGVLKKAGFDFRDPAFWQGGFDILSDIVDQIEALSK